MMTNMLDKNVNEMACLAAETLFETLGKMSWDNFGESQSKPWRLALCYIACRLNPNLKIYNIDESLPYRVHHFGQKEFLNSIANLGYYARSAHLLINEIDERLMPCLFVPDGKPEQPIVIVARDKFYDGAKGSIQRIEYNPKGEAWFFQKYNEDKSSTSKFRRAASGRSWFYLLMGRFHETFSQVFISGLFLNLIALATPLYIMAVYDRVIAPHALDTLPMIAVGAGLAVFIEFVLRSLRSQHLSWLASRLDNIVSNEIFKHLLHLSPSYIERASVSSQISRIKTFESIRDFFSSSVFLSALETPFALIAIAAIAVISGPLVLVPIVMACVYGLLFLIIWRRVMVAIRVSAKAATARQQFMMETIDKLESISQNGLGEAWNKKFEEISAQEAVTSFRLAWLGMIGETLSNAVTVLSAVAVVGFGVHMIWAGTMSAGALVATMILVWRVLSPFYGLCSMIPRLDQVRNSIRQVNNLMEIETEDDTHKFSAKMATIKGRVSFINLGIRYSMDGDPLFAGLTFEAMPGDIVAVTGANGTGKTTLLKAIKGMYAPQMGSIRIDGFDIRQVNPIDLRRKISYVPQKPYFYEGTILENLRFSNPLVSEEQVMQALRQAGALEEVMALPNGLQTHINEHNSIHLPSALQIRLSLVRAYIHEAPILLIDEIPNSLLSDEAGNFMRDFILQNKKKRTIIIVTHREDFLKAADSVVVLRSGTSPLVGPKELILNQLHNEQW